MDMDTQVFNWISNKAPWALVVIVIVAVVAWLLRILNDTSPMIKKLLGPLGRYWGKKSANRFIRSGADYEMMNKQILYLFGRVDLLEWESGLDHGFRVEDESWHRKLDLKFAGDEDIPRRRTYDEYRRFYENRFPYRVPEVSAQDI
jgi:hypothetical protein